MATTMKNGAFQPQWFDRNRASGIPITVLAAKAVWMSPMTRPRICIGNRSVTIAKDTEPTTPANSPVTIRATNSMWIAGGEPAQERAGQKAGIEKEQQFLAIEPIGKARGE